jgi:hypothetical protein
MKAKTLALVDKPLSDCVTGGTSYCLWELLMVRLGRLLMAAAGLRKHTTPVPYQIGRCWTIALPAY